MPTQGITHSDLAQFGDRIEGMIRREVDRLAEQLEKVTERSEQDRERLNQACEDLRIVRHDIVNLKNLRQGRAAMAEGIPSHQSKALVVAAVGMGAALMAIPKSAWEALAAMVNLLKAK